MEIEAATAAPRIESGHLTIWARIQSTAAVACNQEHGACRIIKHGAVMTDRTACRSPGSKLQHDRVGQRCSTLAGTDRRPKKADPTTDPVIGRVTHP